MLNFSTGLTQSNSFRGSVESVEGQDLLAKAFPTGATAPTEVIVPDPARVPAVTRALRRIDGVAQVRPVGRRAGVGVLLNAVLRPDPYSQEAFDLVGPIRRVARQAGGPDVLVGGQTAVEKDLRAATTRDTKLIIPLVLLVVLLVLVVLLRAFVAPLLLIASVVLSFGASLGVAAVVFDVVFGFPGSDPSLPLFAFVFLVALGIDYNIFLMTRVREETLTHGTRQGMVRGLAVTGGVITAAGIVLAGTFSVLAVLPLVFLTEIGFTIAFGVLLDTFIVRSLIVPGGRGAARRPRVVAVGARARRPPPARRRPRANRRSRCHDASADRTRRVPMQSRMLAPAVAVALAGLAAPPSDAAASGLTITNGTCFAAGQPVALSGAGFTAWAPVTLGGATSATVTADVAGAFSTTFPAPLVSRASRPGRVTVTGTDGANPRNAAPPARSASCAPASTPTTRRPSTGRRPSARPGASRASRPAGRSTRTCGRAAGRGDAPLRRRAGCVRHARRAGAARALRPGCARPLAAAGRPAPALVGPHGAAPRHHRGRARGR